MNLSEKERNSLALLAKELTTAISRNKILQANFKNGVENTNDIRVPYVKGRIPINKQIDTDLYINEIVRGLATIYQVVQWAPDKGGVCSEIKIMLTKSFYPNLIKVLRARVFHSGQAIATLKGVLQKVSEYDVFKKSKLIEINTAWDMFVVAYEKREGLFLASFILTKQEKNQIIKKTSSDVFNLYQDILNQDILTIIDASVLFYKNEIIKIFSHYQKIKQHEHRKN